MAYDAVRQKVVAFGGHDGSSYRANLWEWDGTAWSQVTGSITPTARSEHGLAYDTARSKLILFGGNDGIGDRANTWEWSGTDWAQVAGTVTPAGRSKLGLAYDTDRARTVLFGGTGPRNDTWEWSGTNWQQVAGTITPTARYDFGMTYITPTATTGGKVVIFGGTDGSAKDDTWEWNGTAWSQSAAITPTARYGHRLAYDTGSENLVLLGGYSDIKDTLADQRGTDRYEAIGIIRGLKINALGTAKWLSISWNAVTPSGTVKFRTRGADSEAGLSSAPWSNNYYTTAGSAIENPVPPPWKGTKWLEVEATLTSGSTPQLDDPHGEL